MKRKPMRVLAVVPAYNESAAIGGVVAELLLVRPAVDVVVVDDGSTDGTAQAAEEAGARVLRLPINLGIGGAVQTGFRFAARLGYDTVVQVDGDGQHVPSEIPSLIDAMSKSGADVVIGSRFLDVRGYTTSPVRRIGTRVFALVNSLVLGRWISDNTSGFRAYNAGAVRFLSDNYPQDYPEPESVILLGRNGFSIREIPVRMRGREHGHSSISAVRSAYYMVKVLLAIFVDLFKERIVRQEQ
jgi:glycosyltransferase involved in cell wall biosynthesis